MGLWLSHSAIQSSKEQFKGMLTKSVGLILSLKACSNAGYEITYEIWGIYWIAILQELQPNIEPSYVRPRTNSLQIINI